MNKIGWVDQVKGFGIILVVLGHISSPFSQIIYSFHMPLFFIISGFFINPENDIKTEFEKSFKKIFLPFFVYLFIGFIVEIAKRHLLVRDQIIIQDFINALIFMDYSNLEGTYAFVLWFFPALFIGKMLALLILKYLTKNIFRLLVVFIAFFIGYNFNFFLAIDDGFISIPFILLGYYIQNNQSFFLSKKVAVTLIIILIIIFIFFGLPILNQSTKFFDILFLNLLWSCSLSVIIFNIFIWFSAKLNWLSFIGANSLLIFLWHPYTNNIAFYISENFLIKFIISLSLCILLIYSKKFTSKKLVNG